MKKLILSLLMITMLTGCVSEPVEQEEVTTVEEEITTTVETEPVIENISENDCNNVIQKCIADFKSNYSDSIIDFIEYDIDKDGNEELLILCEGALLYNCRELHVYKIRNTDYKYCGAIETMLQCELNDNVFSLSSDNVSYDSFEIYRTSEYNCVFLYSIQTNNFQNNYVSAVVFDSNDMISEKPILVWGIEKTTNHDGEEWIFHKYCYICEKELSDEEINDHLSLIKHV
ncbi:MAG: hypothetical protein IKJ47_04880 [Oscillospiraceae bacterium]|nr:hypothetical protein [Oscillospiraceae bacterium]